jgi:hypothetical protein
VNKIKPNKWVENYGINLQKVRQEHLSTFASSKVKGFMWLFCSHALLVGTRLRGKKAKAEWDKVQLVPKAVTTLHLKEIEAKQSILLALLLEWECLVTGKAVDMDKLYSLCPSDLVLGGSIVIQNCGCLPLSRVLLWTSPRERAGAQPGSLEILGGIGTMPSIPCRPASLV